jgi:hypothetical protein
MDGFKVNDRVETHPSTNAWIFGDRYGDVVKVGRKYVHVKMDRSGRTLRFIPDRIMSIREPKV